MRSLCLAVLALLFVSLVLAKEVVPRDVYRQFVQFETKFGKTYATTAERDGRIRVFAENLRLVEQMNQVHDGAVFGVTKFMDLTPEEFKGTYLRALPRPSTSENAKYHEINPALGDPPASMDWRTVTDVITPVKNQEQCGSCWAFSATEAIESAWVQANNSQQILGPQQIVDCDTYDGGCNGGNTETAYKYVIQAGGQETEKDYPYKAVNGACKFHESEVAAKITSWKYVCKQASDELTTMLSYVGTEGPVSVCVDAAPWQYYNGGVLKSCGMQVDHCVQVVGYDTVSGDDVWITRNSWGADWGENGYIMILRGKNLCDIAGDVTVPIV
jgi:cathepsin F